MDAAVPVVPLAISSVGEVGTVATAGLAHKPVAKGGEPNETLRLLVLSLVVLNQLRGLAVAATVDVAVGDQHREGLLL